MSREEVIVTSRPTGLKGQVGERRNRPRSFRFEPRQPLLVTVVVSPQPRAAKNSMKSNAIISILLRRDRAR